MDKQGRVLAALSSKAVDRVPCSCWTAFSSDSRCGPAAAKVHEAYFKTYDWDFLRAMNELPYDRPGNIDSFTRPADFDQLGTIRANSGNYRLQIETLRLIRKSLGKRVLIAASVPNCWTVGEELADGHLTAMFSRWPRKIAKALQVIAANTARFAKACLKAGANGIFFIASGAGRGGLSPENYGSTIEPLDRAILQGVNEAPLNILYAAGPEVNLRVFADYPVPAVSWDTFRGSTTLAEGKHITGKCVVGGVDHLGALVSGKTVQVVDEVRNAVDDTDGLGLMIAPTGVVAADVQPRDLKVIRAAVER